MGSTTATHGGEDTAPADPAASYLWLWFVCTNTMAKMGKVKDKKNMEHQTDPLQTGSLYTTFCAFWKGSENGKADRQISFIYKHTTPD